MKITNVHDTRIPALTESVLSQLGIAFNGEGISTLEDIARNSADAGWSGFTYYTDTLEFYANNRDSILKLAEELAADLGEDMLGMIANFGCLKSDKLSPTTIAAALYEGKGEDATNVRNAMAWFALEEIARELCPDV
jgi:hypothetical protein